MDRDDNLLINSQYIRYGDRMFGYINK